MITLTREEMKAHPVLNKVLETIIRNHIPAPHTEKELKANRHVKDFCEVSEHFAEIKLVDKSSMYLSYITNSWIRENRIIVQISSVSYYNDWNEYLRYRLSALHSGAVHHNVENN